MRLSFALGVAATLAWVVIGDIPPSVGEEAVDRDEEFFSADDPLDDSSSEGASVAERNRKREEGLPEVGLGEGGLEEKRGGRAVLGNQWVKGHRPNRRAFSPWGGKRYFNPWGGKRFKGIYLERKDNAIFDKRPGFQPWGGKRAAAPQSGEFGGSDESEKRAFSPWGGKRESAPRDRNEGLLIRLRRNENKNFRFEAKP